MANNTYGALLNHGQYSQQNVGTALASSVTLTDISPGGNTAGQALTIGANYLQVGMEFRVRAKGIISNTGTPTLIIGVYHGGVAGTALAATTALATASTLSNSVWILECDLRVNATGTSGSIYALGSVIGPFSSIQGLPASSSSGNLVTSLDTSTGKILTIGAQWGTNSASNSIQVIKFTVEKLNEGGA